LIQWALHIFLTRAHAKEFHAKQLLKSEIILAPACKPVEEDERLPYSSLPYKFSSPRDGSEQEKGPLMSVHDVKISLQTAPLESK